MTKKTTSFTAEQIAAKREALAKEIMIQMIQKGEYRINSSIEHAEELVNAALCLADEFFKQISE